MLVSNYVYEKVGANHKKCIHYRNALPQDEVFRSFSNNYFYKSYVHILFIYPLKIFHYFYIIGDAVNAGLDSARGKYFKVVDSDDWVDEESLQKILELLRNLEEEDNQIDMLVSNYV